MFAGETLSLHALPGLPHVQPGDCLADLILAACEQLGLQLETSDILVITSKIVSKAEGRWLDLRTITPSPRAVDLARETDKPPQLVEAILRESQAVSRYRKGVLIVRHRLGFIAANAGIDHSNVGAQSDDWVLLLPEDPDRSAHIIRQEIGQRTGIYPGIVISDSHGRPFRVGAVGVAIGLAGLPALLDLRGQRDLFGRELQATVVALADAIAAAAGLLSGEADEGRPVVLLRGLRLSANEGSAADLNRDPGLDLYA